jgi:hypothetical protein
MHGFFHDRAAMRLGPVAQLCDKASIKVMQRQVQHGKKHSAIRQGYQ